MKNPVSKAVYILAGSDEYLRQEHLARLLQQITNPSSQANQDTQQDTQTAPVSPPGVSIRWFDSSADLADVLDEVRTVALLGAQRVAIVKPADTFISKHAEALERYFQNPSSNGVIIFIVDSWPVKSSASKKTSQILTRLVKLINHVGEIIDCSAPKGAAVSRWVVRKLQKYGKTITPKAVNLLLQWTNAELLDLHNAIEKLLLYVADRDKITDADVSAIIVSGSEVKPFELCKAINSQDARKALDILSKLVLHRGDEFRTMGLIAWQIRNNLQHANSNPQVQSAIHAMRALLKTDLAMKTGLEPKSAMQLLLVNLCS